MLVRAALTCAALLVSANALAQTPGEWKYTVATDLSNIPADMRVNFPTISFSVCRSEADFSSGRAFALQTLASSAARCPSVDFVRAPAASGGSGGSGGSKGYDTLQFTYACDGGSTLSGSATGRVAATYFSLSLKSTYSPSVNGVGTVRQTMTGKRTGPCKATPDADLLKVQ